MNVIYYQRRRGALECEKITTDGSTTLELRFEESLKGSLRLGTIVKKIDGKSCFFDTGSLEDGVYQVLIYLEGAIIEPEAFEISNGAPRLIPKNDAYVRELSRELEAQRKRLERITEKLRLYDEKINGNPIF